MNTVERETDRGDRLIRRSKNGDNDDPCRYNPLKAASDRAYMVVEGGRDQFQA